MLDLNRVHLGDCRDLLRQIPEGSVHCVVTSPPYWGLRDYGLPATVWGGDPACAHAWGETLPGNSGDDYGEQQGVFGREQGYGRHCPRGAYCSRCGAWSGALGLEPTMAQHLRNIVEVFDLVRRALHSTGTLWLNYGDAYAQGGRAATAAELQADRERADREEYPTEAFAGYAGWNRAAGTASPELRPKQLLGLPWRIAFALQEAGWWLRSDCIWHKPNAMPESVRDRPARDHEYVFLLTKSPRYFYDRQAVKSVSKHAGQRVSLGEKSLSRRQAAGKGVEPSGNGKADSVVVTAGKNLRTVWQINTEPTLEAHFATFPRSLVRRCLLAGSSAAGACAACLAPVRPIYETLDPDPEWQKACGGPYNGTAQKDYAAARAQDPSATKARILESLRPRRLIGSEPSCTCAAGVVRSRVLDPFTGSGTTGVVCAELERDFLGLELNPEYCALANERVAAAYGGITLREHRAGQGALFGQEFV